MYIKTFKDILHNECANCAKNFGDDFSRSEIETSIALEFSNCGFTSPPEDISNFQAVCYIYGVPPPVLESSIKKHLRSVMTARNQSSKESRILAFNDKENDTDDPLDSIRLSLCQNCSLTLAELYTVFYKYERLSNNTSIITKGVKYSKETLGLQDIKLECDQDTDIFDDRGSSHAFNEVGNENSSLQEEEEEQVKLDSMKVEELNPESDHSFNESNTNSEGEENVKEYQELRDFSQDVDVDMDENTYERRVRRSTRRTRNHKRVNESSGSGTEIDEDDTNNEDLYTEIADNSPSSEDSVWSESEVCDKRKSNTNEGKKKVSPLQRRSKQFKTEKNYSGSTSTSNDLEKETIQRFIRKMPGLYSMRCSACKIYFTNTLGFRRHHQVQHKIIWKDNDTLEKWMNVCATKSYNCDICDEFYISREELNYHLITHILNPDTITEFNEGILGPPFRCPICENSEKLYENWARLRLHGYKIHQVAFTNPIVQTPAPDHRRFLETYFCKECDDAPFTIRSAWITHMKHFHSLSGCCICGHTFSSEQMLHSHIKSEHDSIAGSHGYKCKNCDEKFQSIQSLWIHTLFHSVEGIEFFESQTFEEFATELTGSTEIQCKIEKDSKSALINDCTAKSDTNINIFSCLRCGKGFKSFYALIIHQSVQSISDLDTLTRENVYDRDFHCPVCAIDCKRNIILRQHCLSTHHMLVSTKTYSGEEFLKELLIEKDHCNKNLVTSDKLICPPKQIMACKRCSKIFKSFYALKIHESVYKLDISTLEKITLKSTGLICPKCNISFNNTSQRFSRIKSHCLEKHNVMVAVSLSELKRYTQQLIFEKDYCVKNKINQDSNEVINQINIGVEGQSNTTEESIKYDEEIKNKVKTLTSNPQGICYRCGADCGTYYMKKLHEMSHKLDIPSLENEILKRTNYTCTRCGMDFGGKATRLFRLKLHCLEEHNLILAKNAEEFQNFSKQLSEAKEYCNKNKNFKNSKSKSQQSINSVSVDEREISQYTELKKTCSLCDKVCSSYVAKGIHELAHKIDLKTLQVEDVPGTAVYTCPRCAKVFYSNIGIRLHCLEHHNMIASTKSCPGHKFIEFLTDEQESIKKCQQKPAAVMAHDKGEHPLEREVKTGDHQQSTSGSGCFSEENKIDKPNSISTDSVEGNTDGRTNVDLDGEIESEKFVCDVCGKVVATKNSLNAHKMSHRPEKHFVCERCGASFKTANLFRFHKRVHFEKDNGIRPTCNICGKSYISSHGLNKHKTNYHPKKKLNCPICHKTFASQSYTRTHIAKHKQNQSF